MPVHAAHSNIVFEYFTHHNVFLSTVDDLIYSAYNVNLILYMNNQIFI